MSTHLLRVIPMDPYWVPEQVGIELARALLSRLLPGQAVEHRVYDEPVFIDQGENFEDVRCPSCGTVLDAGWWGERMDEADATGFTELGVRCPACGRDTTLNDLDYRLPAGFARFELIVRDGASDLSAGQLAAVGEALGYAVRVVPARY